MRCDKTAPVIMRATTNPMSASGKWATFNENAEQIERVNRMLEYVLDIGVGAPFRSGGYVQSGFLNHSARGYGIKNDCPEKEPDPGLGGALIREQSPDDKKVKCQTIDATAVTNRILF